MAFDTQESKFCANFVRPLLTTASDRTHPLRDFCSLLVAFPAQPAMVFQRVVTREEGHGNYPRAEIKDGQPIAYPNAEVNQLDTAQARETFVSVQSVVIEPRQRLWGVDTRSMHVTFRRAQRSATR